MHSNELIITDEVVRSLILEQVPSLFNEEIIKYANVGTVNSIYLIGDRYYIRMPRLAEWSKDIEKEWDILNRIEGKLSIKTPKPVYFGKPSKKYPLNWAIHEWIDGQDYSDENIEAEENEASKLSSFVNQLHSIKIDETVQRAGRRPLLDLYEETTKALYESKEYIDKNRVGKAWEMLVSSPKWDMNPVFIHGDLLRTNILTKNKTIYAIIDFGSSGVGDPAHDLIPAWTVFNKKGREVFLNEIGQADGTVQRAKGYALHQALLIIPYYYNSYYYFSKLAIRTVNEILNDL